MGTHNEFGGEAGGPVVQAGTTGDVVYQDVGRGAAFGGDVHGNLSVTIGALEQQPSGQLQQHGDGALIAFVRARLDEDEERARAAVSAWGDKVNEPKWADLPDEITGHAFRHDPVRVLREVEAKRRTLEIHRVSGGWEDEDGHDIGLGCDECGYSAEYCDRGGWCETLRHLAGAWADHPDYQQEWTP